MRYESSAAGVWPEEQGHQCGEVPPPPYGDRAHSPSFSPRLRAAPNVYPTEESLLRADALALGLRGALDRIAAPLGRAALGFVRAEGWCEFGYPRLDDHARERFSRSGPWVQDLAALGEALAALPGLTEALSGADGSPPIGRVAALLLARVATPSSLHAWVDLARGITVRQLRDTVARARAAGSDRPCEIGSEQDAAARPPDEEDPADRALVRLPVPLPVLSAFDEAVDLHRAMQGTEATVTSFIEALVAESVAGGEVGDAGVLVPLRTGTEASVVESVLARSTENWRHLPRSEVRPGLWPAPGRA